MIETINENISISESHFNALFEGIINKKEGSEKFLVNTISAIKKNQEFLMISKDSQVNLINNLTKSFKTMVKSNDRLSENEKVIGGVSVIDYAEILAFGLQESGGNPSAAGSTGDRGLMQIKPPLDMVSAKKLHPKDRTGYLETYNIYTKLNKRGVITHTINQLDDIDFTILGISRFLDAKRELLLSLNKLSHVSLEYKTPQIINIDPEVISRLMPLVHNRGSIVLGMIRSAYINGGRKPVTLWSLKKLRYGTTNFTSKKWSRSSQFKNLTIGEPKNVVQSDLNLIIPKPQTTQDFDVFHYIFTLPYAARNKIHPDGKYLIPAKNRQITTTYIEQVSSLKKQFEK